MYKISTFVNPTATDSNEEHQALEAYLEVLFKKDPSLNHFKDSQSFDERKEVLIIAKDDNGKITGCAYGVVKWEWFELTTFWQEEANMAFITFVEEEVVNKLKLKGIRFETFLPELIQFFLRAGFRRNGEIAGFPSGATTTILTRYNS